MLKRNEAAGRPPRRRRHVTFRCSIVGAPAKRLWGGATTSPPGASCHNRVAVLLGHNAALLKVARRREAAKLMRRAQNFWSQPIDERKNDDSAGSGNSVGKDLHRQMAAGRVK